MKTFATQSNITSLNEENSSEPNSSFDIGFWDWDLQSGGFCCSSHIYRSLGCSTEEFSSWDMKSWSNLIHPDDIEQFNAGLENHLTGKTETFEILCREKHKSGQWFWFLIKGKVVIRDVNGHPIRMVGTHTDVSRLKQTEKELELTDNLLSAINYCQSEQFQKDNYNEISIHLIETIARLTNSEYGLIGEVLENEENKPYVKTISFKAAGDQRNLGANFKKTDEDLDKKLLYVEKLLEQVVHTKETLLINDTSHSNSDKLSSNLSLLDSFIGIPIKVNGKLIALIGLANRAGGYNSEIQNFLQPLMATIGNVVQVQHHVQLQLEMEQILKLFIENTPAAVAMFDRNFHYLLTSKAWRRDYHLEGREIIGKYCYDVFPNVPSEWKVVHQRCLQGKVEKIDEVEFVKEDGTSMWLKWEAHPWYKSNKMIGGMILFAEIITERKNIEIKMQKMIDGLKRSNGELERFAYICSHDIKEPLRTISSFVHLIHRHNAGNFDEITQEYFSYVRKGVERMRMLIEDILVYSKVDSNNLHHTIVSISDLIEEIKETLASTIEENKVIIETSYLPEIYGDYTQLTQLFRNLIENAIKFRSEKIPVIKIDATSLNGFWYFTVKDNGLGISEEYHQKVFQMFERLHGKEKYEGSGIGLALCKKVVESHGGSEIGVRSNKEGGAEFYFTLPSGLIRHKLTA
ncbi:MAG: PAS domain S-box protein [Alphaproteobacteria bacterium]|nr:PAS domain S-box protein [Alphaproteobacteria bacterium]